MSNDNSKKRPIEKNFVGGNSDKVDIATGNFNGGDSSKVMKSSNENFVGGDNNKVPSKDKKPPKS